MNKKGQYAFFGISMFFILVVAGINMMTPVKDVVIDVRGSDKLNCSDPNLTTGQKANCIQVDWVLFGYAAAVLGTAFAYLNIKRN